MQNLQLDHNQHKASAQKYSLCFLAHNVDVSVNVGSFFRIADALGVEKIYLTGDSLTPPNDKIKKTSRSTEKYVPFAYEKNPLAVLARLKLSGYKIISLEITSSSIAIENLALRNDDKICLILGSESAGVSQELLDISDVTIHIPMLGENSSMNVANACSIATYEITRQLKRSAG